MLGKKYKIKKTFSCRFADGQVKKIVGYDYNPHTKMMDLTIRKGHLMGNDTLNIPRKAIIGLGQTGFIMKGGKFCFCCHTYDSSGNPISQGSDDLTLLTIELIKLEEHNKFLIDQVNTLQYDINELLKTRKGITEEIASDLRKLVDSSVTQVRRYKYTPMEVPPEFIPPMEKGEE